MPSDSFLHERNDFKALVETVADSEKINDPALVEKDYWIMHAVFGLKQLGLTFELKGGTSLSKGFGVIHRFSEDIDIRIEPFDGLQVDTNPNHEKPQHIESRRVFYEKLRDKINIPGITAVDRDTTYDDEPLRNAGLRLRYETHFGSIAGLKDGILLEVGFDQTPRTEPSQSPLGSSCSPMLRNFDTRTTEPSTSPAITPNTLSWKRSRLWFENTASSKQRGKPQRTSSDTTTTSTNF